MKYIDSKNRPSIIKRIKVSDKITVDLVKTNHLLDRFISRNFNWTHVISLAEKSLGTVLKQWYKRNLRHTQGVLQHKNLNVMFGIHQNEQTNNIDFEITSAMEKTNFFTNNIPDVLVIRK